MKRRTFIKRVSAASALVGMGALPLEAFSEREEIVRISILHTNDMHSRIDPFPMDGGRMQGLGGMAKRATLVKKIRSEEPNILLLDAGDIFQGTPYFNYYGGEIEFKLMSQMGYDAATMGNHDFDGGIDGFEKQLTHADFPFLTGNYDFSDTILNGKTKNYTIIEKQGIKIGITGVGIELKGLVPESLIKKTRYLDPINELNKNAKFLKEEAKCDYVICLSHLGYEYDDGKISDVRLAKMSENVDLILGGHTHTFLEEPVLMKNVDGKPVIINQVGWGGAILGRLNLFFEYNKKHKCVSCKNNILVI